MYKCSECDKLFDEPGHFYLSGEFWGAPFTEKIPCCPYCESEFFVDVDELERLEEEEDEPNEDPLEGTF